MFFIKKFKRIRPDHNKHTINSQVLLIAKYFVASTVIFSYLLLTNKIRDKRIVMKCIAYSSAQSYNLISVANKLKNTRKKFKRFNEVVFYQSNGEAVYIFSFGAVVIWGTEKTHPLKIVDDLIPYATYPSTTLETEDFFYKVGNKTLIDGVNDTIVIEDETNLMYRLSLSYALAQSIKLAAHEKELKSTVEAMSYIPQSLAKTGGTTLKRKEIGKKMGELYLTKSAINSNLNIIHTPKIIWDSPEIEPYYNMAAEFLELYDRVESLNMGLSMIQDLLKILEDQLNHRHSSMLEWIIVLLIFVEVVLFIAKDFPHS